MRVRIECGGHTLYADLPSISFVCPVGREAAPFSSAAFFDQLASSFCSCKKSHRPADVQSASTSLSNEGEKK